MRVVVVALLLAFASTAHADVFYTNNKGPGNPYSIGRFVDGTPSPMVPVIQKSGVGFDSHHIAWPSAVRVGSEIWVFAAGNNNVKWGAMGLWKSPDGVTFTRIGAVLTADATEIEIRMPHVIYDPTDVAAPFKAWYGTVINAQGLSTEIRYATSVDGQTWTRHGAVVTAAAPFDAAGLAPDYVCKDSTETWHLFYTAFPTLTNANATEATASAPNGPYTKSTIFPADGISVSVTNTPTPGSAVLVVSSTAGLRVNGTYVLSGGTQAKSQAVTIASISGNWVLLEGPLHITLTGPSTLYSIAKRKVSPSYVYEDGGEWFGLFTGFGPIDGILSEYVFRVKKTASGWVFDDSSAEMPFPPLLWPHLYSTENAEPVRTGPSCSK